MPAAAAPPEQQVRLLEHRDMTRQLEELAAALHPLEAAQKSVILMSEGITLPRSATAAFVDPDLVRMHRSFRSAGVTLNAIDLGGVRGPFDRDKNNEQLFTLALDTGGHVLHSRNDFLEALRDLEERESVVYILGFRMKPNAKSGASAIRVKVRNIGAMAEVRHRTTFAPAKPSGESISTVMLADVMLNDIPWNGLTVSSSVEVSSDGATITASVPGREVLAYVGATKAIADVYLYVFDAQSSVAWWSAKRLNIDGAAAREHLEANALQVGEVLKLAPGRYVAKVLVRVRGSEAVGFMKKAFEVTP